MNVWRKLLTAVRGGAHEVGAKRARQKAQAGCVNKLIPEQTAR